MKKLVSILLFMAILFPAFAQESGIRFFHGTWQEGVDKALKENKKIFVDFFTEWCGPCLNMSLEVFPLPQVGEVYNKNFVCMKIDAEKGEGVELARKYGVYSYPTYIFVDPSTQKMIHRSGGNKPAADFIADVEGALNPQLSSIYLDEKYKSGDYDMDFLISYMHGKKVSGARDQTKNFEKLLSMGGKITDKKIWDVYCECVPGYDNPYVKQISDNYDQFVSLFGKESVDAKLAEATRWAPAEFTQNLCDFEGKDYNVKMATMSRLLRNKTSDEGWNYVDKLIADPTIDKAKLAEQLMFYTRLYKGADRDMTFEQVVRVFKYARYVAYNMYDREDAMAHYNYAMALETLINRSIAEGKAIPADLLSEPTQGKKEYDMRHPLLKPKPVRRK